MELLPHRQLRRDLLELPDQVLVVPQPQLGPHPLLQRRGPQLAEPARGAVQQRSVRGVREQRAAPQRQRPALEVGGRRMVAALHRLPAALVQLLEGGQVQLGRIHAQQIAGRPGHQRVPPVLRIGLVQQFAQLGHVHLERGHRRARRMLAPQLVDQAVHRNGLVRPHEQCREHHPDLRGPGREGGPARPRCSDLQRTQNPKSHAPPPPWLFCAALRPCGFPGGGMPDRRAPAQCRAAGGRPGRFRPPYNGPDHR